MTTFTPSIKGISTPSVKSIKYNASQLALNIMVFIALAVLLITPGAVAYFCTMYLEHVAGLIPLLGYLYAYNVIRSYFYDN